MKRILLSIFLLSFLTLVLCDCVCNHGHCNGDTCVCNDNYEGFDCSIYNKVITSGVAENDTLSQYNWKYYSVQIGESDTSMKIKLTETSNGDIDIYVSNSKYPGNSNNVAYDDSSDTVVNLEITLNPGTYYIGLYGYAACSYSLLVTVQEGCINNCNGNGNCDLQSLTCTCFTPYIGLDCSIYNLEIAMNVTYRGILADHKWIYYYFTNEDVGDLTITLTQQSTSAVQLYVNRGSLPSFLNFFYANTTLSTTVEMKVQNLQPDVWEIGLYAYTGGTYSVKAIIDYPEIPNCVNNCSLHGTCAGTVCTCDEGFLGDNCEYLLELAQFEVEYNGLVSSTYWNYYPVQYISTQSIKVHLSKTNGTCNMYIRPSSYPTRVIYQYIDTTTDQEVDLVIQYPGSTVWYVGIYGYSDCTYTLEFSFVDRCQCSENANGHCEEGSTYCSCDPGWAGPSCDIQATRLSTFGVVHDSVLKNGMKYYYYTSNSSAMIVTLVEKSTKGFVWLLIGTDGFPTLDDHDDLNYGYAGELSFHENRYLWSSKRERTHYFTVLGSSIDISPDPVQYAITVYSTPF